jgi:hypothetical protein
MFGGSLKKVYSLAEVTVMLPLLTTISKDMERNMSEMGHLILNNEQLEEDIVEFALQLKANYHQEIKKELDQLSARVCHARYGFIDMPVLHPHLQKIVHVCINEHAQPGKLKAHFIGEATRLRTFFWSL